MRVLSVRQDHEAEDVAAARAVLRGEIADPKKSIMVVQGSEEATAAFADRAAARSDPFPWREAIWLLQPDKVLSQKQWGAWFPDRSQCAVVLDLRDQVSGRLDASSDLLAIEQAFLVAQGGSGV